jgi:pimeloyl-ACP methyl ester carboxylesterase
VAGDSPRVRAAAPHPSVAGRTRGTQHLHRSRLRPLYVGEVTAGILDNPEIREDLAAFIRSLRPEVLLGASSRLGYLQGHAAVIWPRHDIFFPARDGRRIAALLDTSVTWADRAKTFVPVDRPDLVAAAVQRLLRSTADIGQHTMG